MTGDLLAYDDVGTGPPIVLVHGLTFSRRTWDPIVERLRDRYGCIAVDLPGHGDSAGSAADPREVGARLHETVQAAGVESPIVVGHSVGAMIAVGYASEYPAAGVVAVDQSMLVGPFAGFVQQLAPALRGPDFEHAFAPFEQSMRIDLLPEPEYRRVAATRHIDQAVVLDHWTMPLTTPPVALQQTVNDMLDAVRVPYLWLAGEDIPVADSELLRAHVPGAEIEAWPGNGHLVHLAQPDRFAARVAKFVDGALRTS